MNFEYLVEILKINSLEISIDSIIDNSCDISIKNIYLQDKLQSYIDYIRNQKTELYTLKNIINTLNNKAYQSNMLKLYDIIKPHSWIDDIYIVVGMIGDRYKIKNLNSGIVFEFRIEMLNYIFWNKNFISAHLF